MTHTDEYNEDTCSTDGCGRSLDDGEGYDGYCGDCADRRESAGTYLHHDALADQLAKAPLAEFGDDFPCCDVRVDLSSPTCYSHVTLDEAGTVIASERHDPEYGTDTWHRVEESARVYLRLSPDGREWEIDDAIDDGYALDGLSDSPDSSACECEDHDAHRRFTERAPGLPTADALLVLLADHFGYSLVSKAQRG